MEAVKTSRRGSFVVLESAAAVGRLQDAMGVISLLVACRESGFAAAQASAAAGAFVIASGALAAPKGRATDRYGPVVVRVQAIATGLSFILLLLSLGKGSVAGVVGSALLMGAVRINAGMLMQGTWGRMEMSEKSKSRAVSWEVLVNTAVQAAGPFMAALLIAVASGRLALAACGFLVTTSMLVWSSGRFHGELGVIRSTSSVFHTPARNTVICLAAIGFVTTSWFAVLQLLLSSAKVGTDAALLVGVFTAGGACATLGFAVRGFTGRRSRFLLIVIGTACMALPLYMVTSGQGLVLIVAVLVLSGALYASASVATRLIMVHVADRNHQFESLSALVSASSLGAGLGFLAGGAAVSAFGISEAGALCSLLAVLSSVLILLLGQAFRNPYLKEV